MHIISGVNIFLTLTKDTESLFPIKTRFSELFQHDFAVYNVASHGDSSLSLKPFGNKLYNY